MEREDVSMYKACGRDRSKFRILSQNCMSIADVYTSSPCFAYRTSPQQLNPDATIMTCLSGHYPKPQHAQQHHYH
jgi:hypothetical protein